MLLSVDYEQSSHVQVLFGYDERLGALYVQDPNLFDPFVVSEDELAKWYAGTHYLSIVALPREKAALAAELPKEEDRYFRELHALAEKMDEDEQAHFAVFVAFLRQHEHIPYTWLYVMKHFSSDETKPLVLEYTERVLNEYPEHNDLLLMAAKAYVYTQEMEKAEDVLKRVKGKAQSPLYHYLRGRIAFFASRYEEAARYFRTSLQLDPDQPEVWSYFGLASAYAGHIEKGSSLRAWRSACIRAICLSKRTTVCCCSTRSGSPKRAPGLIVLCAANGGMPSFGMSGPAATWSLAAGARRNAAFASPKRSTRRNRTRI
ncbi:Tetratricopeptide repeat protein [Geobacillus sp. BCO2]|nr:Tetratricopeptide repeat protein [Geobacillus sp. BCO2]